MDNLVLECPNCRDCHSAQEWNEAPGLRDALIPEYITVEEWDDFKTKHTGRIDCPSCGEVAIYEDMIAV